MSKWARGHEDKGKGMMVRGRDQPEGEGSEARPTCGRGGEGVRGRDQPEGEGSEARPT